MGAHRLMVVLIVNTGRVEQRVMDWPVDLSGADGEQPVAGSARRVNADAVGLRPRRRRRRAAVAAGAVRAGRAATSCAPSSASLDDALVEEREERVVLAGTANLARFGTDFPLTIGPVLEALEEHVVLLKLLRHLGRDSDAVAVRIGHENPSRRAAVDLGRLHRLRHRPRAGRRSRRARPDPDGLPHDDGVGARRRPLRLRDPVVPDTPRTCQGKSLNDYYQDLGVAADAGPEEHQAGLPQAGPQAAPRRQPEPRGRGAVQEGLARPTTCSPTPRSAGRSTWAPTPTRGGAAGGFGQGFSFSDIMDAFFGARRAGRPRPPLAPAPRPGRPDPARRRPGRRGLRRRERADHRHRRGLLHLPR